MLQPPEINSYCLELLPQWAWPQRGIRVSQSKRQRNLSVKDFLATPQEGLYGHKIKSFPVPAMSRQEMSSQDTRRQIKRKVIDAYGGKCVCCGESSWEFLTIDHPDGDGAQHRRITKGQIYRDLIQRGFPEGFQVMCLNCNLSIGFYGYCPHNPEVQRPVNGKGIRGAPTLMQPINFPVGRWCPPSTIAKLYKRSVRTVVEWCNDGTLVAFGFKLIQDVGGRWWINPPNDILLPEDCSISKPDSRRFGRMSQHLQQCAP